jgi:hypothetical protein
MDFKIRQAVYSDFEGLFPLLKQLWSDLILDFVNWEKTIKN